MPLRSAVNSAFSNSRLVYCHLFYRCVGLDLFVFSPCTGLQFSISALVIWSFFVVRVSFLFFVFCFSKAFHMFADIHSVLSFFFFFLLSTLFLYFFSPAVYCFFSCFVHGFVRVIDDLFCFILKDSKLFLNVLQNYYFASWLLAVLCRLQSLLY